MLMRDLSGKEVALKADMPETYLSGVLGTRPTNNAQVYRKISHAIGMSNSEFDNMVQEAQMEAFWGTKGDMRYALSSKLGDNPDAIREVEGFMDFVKQKYWIK